MGTLTDNLLKLTEFPFSYSFIGLLILVFTQPPVDSGSQAQQSNSTDTGPGFFSEESLANYLPIVVLMGFFASTLSIVDPIGYLQKTVLIGWFSLTHQPLNIRLVESKSRFVKWFGNIGFIRKVFRIYRQGLGDWSKPETWDIAEKIETIPWLGWSVKEMVLPWVQISLLEDFEAVLKRVSKDYQGRSTEINNLSAEKIINEELPLYIEEEKKRKIKEEEELKNEKDEKKKEKKRAKNEKDRIGRNPAYRLYNRLLELKYRTSQSTWLAREIDKITGLWYFVAVVSTFIIAQILKPEFLGHFPLAKEHYVIVFILSIIALAAILIMLYFRHRELTSMAGVTFKFLSEQAAIKVDKESFDKTLENIRQYLNEGDWTLAGIWVTRLMHQYDDFIKEKVKKGDFNKPEDNKIEERTIKVKWNNQEMTVEEFKEKA
jgi:hypothetical protein